MKFKDAIKNPKTWDKYRNTINKRWDSLNLWRSESLKRLTNYLFILNSGALWSSFAYLAKPEITMTPLLRGSIEYFSAGTVLILVHATIDYYICEHLLRRTDNHISEYYANKLQWDKFKKNLYANPKNSRCIDIVGWGSGVSFVLGLLLVGISFL